MVKMIKEKVIGVFLIKEYGHIAIKRADNNDVNNDVELRFSVDDLPDLRHAVSELIRMTEGR